jgi:hypothetical protein
LKENYVFVPMLRAAAVATLCTPLGHARNNVNVQRSGAAMDEDRTEQLQRSIDALLVRIEEQKQVIGWLLQDSGPRLVCSVKPLPPWFAMARRRIKQVPLEL